VTRRLCSPRPALQPALCASGRPFLDRVCVGLSAAAPVNLLVRQAAVVQVGTGLVQLRLGLCALGLALGLTSAGGLLSRRLAMLACELAAAVIELALAPTAAHARQDYRQQHKQDQNADDDCDDRSG